jgi:hypothetical protein
MQPSGRPVGKPHLTQEEWARGDQFANSAPTGGASKKDCQNSTLLSLKKSHVRPLPTKQDFLIFLFFAAFQFQTIQIQRNRKENLILSSSRGGCLLPSPENGYLLMASLSHL